MCHHGVQATDDEVELHVIVVVLVLDLPIVPGMTMSKVLDVLRATYGVTFTPGTRFMMYSAATVAFGLPTSCGLVAL